MFILSLPLAFLMLIKLVLSETCIGISVDGEIICDMVKNTCFAQLKSNEYYFIDSFQNKTVVDGCINMSIKGILYVCCTK